MVPLSIDVNFEQIARGTPGFSGAELFNLVNQAALKAAMDGLQRVGEFTNIMYMPVYICKYMYVCM